MLAKLWIIYSLNKKKRFTSIALLVFPDQQPWSSPILLSSRSLKCGSIPTRLKNWSLNAAPALLQIFKLFRDANKSTTTS